MAEEPKAPPPGMPTQEQIEMALRHEISFTLANLVGALAPHFDQASMPALIDTLVAEQQVVQTQIFPAFLDPNIRSKRRELWIMIKGPDGIEGVFKANKEFDPKDPGLAISTALVLTFLLNAGIRGLLRIWGYNYRFVEPKPKDTPRIIM